MTKPHGRRLQNVARIPMSARSIKLFHNIWGYDLSEVIPQEKAQKCKEEKFKDVRLILSNSRTIEQRLVT
jgi:hypothetical protein